MPSQFRGFNANEVLDQFMQMDSFMRHRKDWKRKEEDRDLAEKNPLPTALEKWQELRQGLGDAFKDDPQVMEQFMNRFKMAPEQRQMFQGQTQQVPSLAAQKRKQDFRKELMNYEATMAEMAAKNKYTMELVSKDPEMAKLFGSNFRSQEEQLRAAHRKAIEAGYADVLRDPEAQQWMQQTFINSIMGGPGSSNFGQPTSVGPMPSTQIPNLQLKGSFGR